MLIWILIIIGIIAFDQATKLLAVLFLRSKDSFVVIDGVFRFTYVENNGAAFGMLDDKRWIFMLLSTVGIIAMIIILLKFTRGDKLLCTALSFVIGGGIGNMIDRVSLGYVIDFIDFCAFPNLWVWVFNVADSFVCIGAALMLLYVILDAVKEMKKKRLGNVNQSDGDKHELSGGQSDENA